jgi:glucan 1,3-beta-glucosidase
LGGVLASRNSDKKASTEHTVIQAADGSSGGDGSTVTMDDGTTFIYNNSFGGNWVATPLDFSARCRENVKPLSEPWDYSYDRIHGVNLGGWFGRFSLCSPEFL